VVALPDWILGILSLLGVGGGGGLVGYIRHVKTESEAAKNLAETNEQRLVGDADDPNSKGVLQISHQNGEKLDELEAQMTKQHRELMTRMDDITDE
jgi:hypothetical protein